MCLHSPCSPRRSTNLRRHPVFVVELALYFCFASIVTCCADEIHVLPTELANPTFAEDSFIDFNDATSTTVVDYSTIARLEQITVDPLPDLSSLIPSNDSLSESNLAGLSPWWNDYVSYPLGDPTRVLPIAPATLFAMTIVHSGRVQAVAQTPWIAASQLTQAQAVFDPNLFMDNRFDSTSDPVESTLVTGGPPRLEDQIWGADAGVRGQMMSGSSYTIGQRLGWKDSNSTFFEPANQGTARLHSTFTKPLMRGRETDTHRTLILTAQFETQSAKARYAKEVQKQLMQVADTYWSLFVERASLHQRKRHLQRAKEIADRLSSRENHDSSTSQILRAKAAVSNRTAELVQVETQIRNIESQLRALVNAPELVDDRQVELIPIQAAALTPTEYLIDVEVAMALQQRPELEELEAQTRAVRAQIRLAQDQTKPTLNLVGEGYLAGLQGDSNIGSAWVKQFDTGRPGYAGGLVYEQPMYNRAARASVRQRQFELKQLDHLLREGRENIRAEVESAVRNVHASRQTAISRQASLSAVESEVDYLFDRWQTLGNDPRLGTIQLNDLLLAQDRLLEEEQALLKALVSFNRSLMELQRATGALISFE